MIDNFVEKSYLGWIRKNRGIHPSFDFFDFPCKNEKVSR